MGRAIRLAVATTPVYFVMAAAAGAATYFVDQGGADVGDCTTQAAPCASIGYAIDQHRSAPQPDDVVAVGPGEYSENVDASDPADDGLTIRGSLTPGGNPDTEISGTGATGAAGCVGCIVALGTDPDTEVDMENVEVTQQGTDVDSDLIPIVLGGGSDLTTVDVEVVDTNTFSAVELCNVPGSVITDAILDSTGTNAAGLDGCAAVRIVDSGIFTDDGTGVNVPGTTGETTEIVRSVVSAGESSPGDAVAVDGDFVLDSSLVVGAATAVNLPGSTAAEINVNNATIDAATPGVDDGTAIFLGRAGADPLDATVDSTIVVDQLFVDFPGAPLTLTCGYSNITDISTPVDTTDFTNDCPQAGDPGSTNTAFDPADIFEDPVFGDWSQQADAPTIDAGQPGAVPAGFSTTDIDGDPRRQAGTTATCPDGVRDQGAFEAPGVACSRTLTVLPMGTGTGTVTGPGIDCGGAGHTDCTETVPSGGQIELTATAAEGSRFDGFTGGGCSTSPCRVTLDANKSVQAHFNDVSRVGSRSISLEADKRRVRKGRFLTLSGRVLGAENECVANQTIQLLRKRPGQSGFDPFRTVKTDASGRFTRTFAVKRPPREFVARLPQGATCDAAESDAVTVGRRKPR